MRLILAILFLAFLSVPFALASTDSYLLENATAYLKFDDRNGTNAVADNYIPGFTDGWYNNTRVNVSGRYGGGLQSNQGAYAYLDDTTQAFECGDGFKTCSWQFWVYRNTSSTFGYLVHKSTTYDAYTWNDAAGSFGADVDGSGYINTTGLPAGGWTHFLFTYDGTTFRTYTNGTLTRAHSTTASTGNNTNNIGIGAGGTVPGGSYPNATLDEYIFWYDRVITAGEAMEIFLRNRSLSYEVERFDITFPLTSNPKTTSANSNISINTTLVNGTVYRPYNITNITIGTEYCVILNHTINSSCTGTESACTTYGTSGLCTAAGCSWGSTVRSTHNKNWTNYTMLSGTWTTPQNGGSSDDLRATGTAGQQINYSKFPVNIPSGATINGINVTVEASASSNTGTNELFIAVNNGTHTSTRNTTGDLGTGDSTLTFGNSLWGLTWDYKAANNISINATSGATSTRSMRIDLLVVNITYTTNACSGTPTTCNNLRNNASQCPASGCTYTASYKIPQHGNLTPSVWETNCTVGPSCSGSSDLTVWANASNTVYSDVETNAINCAADTCTYGGSGDWAIACTDSCNLVTNTNLLGNNITFSGAGLVRIRANFTNLYKVRIQDSCTVRCEPGGCTGLI